MPEKGTPEMVRPNGIKLNQPSGRRTSVVQPPGALSGKRDTGESASREGGNPGLLVF
ncbi:MAG: hypothetical protein M0Z75_04230 [Nitrospiraceae bacterium]|nr:hypothetical protein [Nitrospiraceae bacterium]